MAVAPPSRRAPPSPRAAQGVAVALEVARGAARLGRPRRAAPAEPPQPRRVRAAPARAPRRRRAGRPAARRPAPRAGRGRGSGAERAPGREGPRHRVLHGVRPAFKPVDDSSYAGSASRRCATRSAGSSADLAVAVAAVLAVALLALPVLALLRVTRVAAGHRRWALRAAAVLAVVWVALRVAGAPVASSSAAALAVDEVQAVQTGLGDRAVLARQIAHDRFGTTPGDRLLTGLRGKDVLLVFVESYGRVAVQGSSFSPAHQRRARPGQRAAAGRRLLRAQRVPHLADLRRPQLAGALHPAVGGPGRRPAALRPARRQRRLTLTRAFKRAGWRAVGAHAREPPRVAGGRDLLRLRQGLRPPQLRLPRPALRPAADARPVRDAGAAAPRARRAPTGRRCSPRSTSSRATRRGRASPG